LQSDRQTSCRVVIGTATCECATENEYACYDMRVLRLGLVELTESARFGHVLH